MSLESSWRLSGVCCSERGERGEGEGEVRGERAGFSGFPFGFVSGDVLGDLGDRGVCFDGGGRGDFV